MFKWGQRNLRIQWNLAHLAQQHNTHAHPDSEWIEPRRQLVPDYAMLNVQQLANNLLASYRRHSLASFRSSVKTSRLNCQGDLGDFSEEKPFVNRIFAFWRVALGSVLSSVFGGAGGAPVSHRFASLGGRSLD